MFRRRLGPDPHEGGNQTANDGGCPDIWELENGEIAIIGRVETPNLSRLLPSSASCGRDEAIVVIPRATLIGARADIPEK